MARSLVIRWRELIGRSALPRSVKAVAQGMAAVAMTGDGFLECSRGQIAQWSGCSLATVKRALRVLETAGLLRVDRTVGGRGVMNRYQVLIPSETGSPLTLFRPPKRGQREPLSAYETGSGMNVNGVRVTPTRSKTLEDLSRAGARAHADPAPLAGAEGHERSEGDGYGSAAEAAAAFRRRLVEREQT